MRPVTPAVRAGRTAAGAAIAATMLFGGSAAATADGSNQADGAAPAQGNAAPAVLPAVDAKPSQIQKLATSTASADQGSVLETSRVENAMSVKSADQIAEDKAEQEAAEQEAAEQEAAEQAAAEQEAAEQAAADDAQDDQSQGAEDDQAQESTTSGSTSSHESSSNSGSSSSRSSHSPSSSSSSKSKKSTSDSSEEKSPSSSSSSASGNSIVATARSGKGTPYVYGGTSTSGWDCSGFTRWVYAQNGISLGRTDSAQAARGRVVSQSEARPGDLIRKPGHIGIYIGNGKMIDAGNPRVGTVERDIYSGSWTYITYTH